MCPNARIRRFKWRSHLRTFREDRMTSMSFNFSIKLKINARMLIKRVNALGAVRFEYHEVTRCVKDKDYRREWMSKSVIFSWTIGSRKIRDSGNFNRAIVPLTRLTRKKQIMKCIFFIHSLSTAIYKFIFNVPWCIYLTDSS